MMLPDPAALARLLTEDCGLAFVGRTATSGDGSECLEFVPGGHAVQQTFLIRAIPGWRNLHVVFLPGTFAADLIAEMGRADSSGRAVFRAVVASCTDDGATVSFRINGAVQDISDPDIWPSDWTRIELSLKRGQLDINSDDELRLIRRWTGRLAAAALSLMPLEEIDDAPSEAGLPEGATLRVEVNRYERDRRNRAAAIAIHGYGCKACDIDLGQRYGVAGSGFIEVHHLSPVSTLGPGYIINPATDLVPLCPNCHGIAHRRTPPFTIAEIRTMMAKASF